MKVVKFASITAAALMAVGMINMNVAQAGGECVDKVTAGGWVEVGTDLFANFGLNASLKGGVPDSGHLNFVNADETCHVVGHEVLSYSVDGDCRTIEFAVTFTLNGVPQEGTATVFVCDTGEKPGTDAFGITVFDSASIEVIECSVPLTTLANGDVQTHAHGNCP